MAADLLNIGIEHHRGGRLGDAEGAYRALLSREPGNPDAMHWLGVLLLQAGQLRKGASLLEQAAAMRPANASYAHNAAQGLLALGDVDAAIKLYRRAAELDPAGYPSLVGLATAYLARRGEGDVPAARDALQKAMAIGADSADVHHAMAIALLHCGDFAGAEKESRAALQRRGDFAEAYCQLGLSLRNLGDFPGARQALADAQRVDPQCARAFHALGAMEAQAGELSKAEALFRKAIGLRPDYAAAYQALGRVLQQAGKSAEAMAMMANSVKLSRAGNRSNEAASDAHVGSTVAELQRKLTPSETGAALQFSLATQAKLLPPAQVPAVAVANLFDRYADRFDHHLRDTLQYRVPEMVAEALAEMAPKSDGGAVPLDILDLGCGTGLCGALLKPMAKTLAGVDLSPAMIEKSRARGVYDALECRDLIQYLRGKHRSADLIVAADVFVYLGDLAPVFDAAAKALRTGGMLVFSVEAGGGERFTLSANGRYQHALAYLEHLARIFGFSQRQCREIVVRTDNLQPVNGYLMFLVNA
jgi:predicted TPR repeat methyltransferase